MHLLDILFRGIKQFQVELLEQSRDGDVEF